jgi:diguanylate cyclase (GGDEF)-like protein
MDEPATISTERLGSRRALGDRSWRVCLAAGATAIVAYFTVARAIPHGTEVDYFLIGVGTVISIILGVKWNRPARRLPWYMLAAGMALWAIGDGLYNASISMGVQVPYPSLSDPLFLIAYPFLGAGLMLTRERRRTRSEPGAFIEAAIITLSASLASWVLLMRPYLDDATATFIAKAVSISYPIGDLVLLGVMIPMLGATGKRSPSTRLLMSWLTLLLATDVIYSAMAIQGSYVDGAWIDAGWLIGYVLLGAAALHPSMARPVEHPSQHATRRTIGPLTLGLLAIASLAGPTLLVVEAINRDWSAAAVTACGCVVLASLVLLRLTGLVRQSDASRQELDETLAQLSFQTLHDHLTGLANRALFADRVEHASARFARTNSTFAVLALDLDDFKGINDAFGHSAGDELLTQVAARLAAIARSSDTVARLGGDEFAILVEGLDGVAVAITAAERVIAAVGAPMLVGGRTITPSASVGIAVHDPGSDWSETLRHADLAMYSAKQDGKERFVVFAPGMGDAEMRWVELEADMLLGFETDPAQFVIHYQPIIAIGTGRIEAVEALVRWNHPTRGLLSPDQFLPIAERTGLIVQIGMHVCREACRQVGIWRRLIPEMEGLGVSVNLSTKQVESPDLVRDVTDALSAAHLDPAALTLELTEDLLVGDAGSVDERLRALSRLGIHLAIDDFGTGNASLSYLRRFPIAELKIDRSYVQGLGTAGERPEFVQGLLSLGSAVGLRVVAEGIEKAAEAQSLLEMGCQSGQGFLFGRPEGARTFERTLMDWADRHHAIALVV